MASKRAICHYNSGPRDWRNNHILDSAVQQRGSNLQVQYLSIQRDQCKLGRRLDLLWWKLAQNNIYTSVLVSNVYFDLVLRIPVQKLGDCTSKGPQRLWLVIKLQSCKYNRCYDKSCAKSVGNHICQRICNNNDTSNSVLERLITRGCLWRRNHSILRLVVGCWNSWR